MSVVTETRPAGRTLIDTDLFARLVDDIVVEHSISRELAERVMDQTLVFLFACARSTEHLSPSIMVDWGWHAYLMRTAAYRSFCEGYAGRFIDHEPAAPGTPDGANADALKRAISAAQDTGYHVDLAVWTGAAASCGETGCASGRPPAVA